MALKYQLNTPGDYPEYAVVTVNSDGKPLSYIYDIYWDYSAMQATGNGKLAKVSFRGTPPQYRRQIQKTVHAFTQQEKARNGKLPSYAQINNYRWGLGQIAELLGSTDWALLSDDVEWKQFKKALKNHVHKERLGQGVCYGLHAAINKLNRQGYCARDITFKDLGVSGLFGTVKQAIAVPIVIYTSFLRSAIATLEKYHPYRQAISEVMTEAYRIADDVRAQAVIDNCTEKNTNQRITRALKKIDHTIPDFKVRLDGEAVGKIQYQCAMVILAFSGVRIGELLSFNKDSYRIVKSVPVLQGETTKGEDGRPRSETWQTHPIAKDALELAHEMTEYLREMHLERIDKMIASGADKTKCEKYQKEANSTFIGLVPKKNGSLFVNRNLSPKLGQHFKDAVTATSADVDEFDRLNPSRAGTLVEGKGLPKLSPHDFRRTFAVFFKRYGFGSSNTIKFQYKHDNIQMSDYYANNAQLQAMEDILLDNDLLQLLQEEGIMMGVDIFDEIYNESEVLSGEEGKRIANDKFKKMQGGHQVYMTRDEIESLLRSGALSVVKLPTGGYCTNPECSRLCGLKEFAADKKPCSHKVITDKGAKVMLRENKRLITTFRGMNTGDHLNHSILVGLKQKIQRNELTLKEHNIKFDPFTDKVKGLIQTEVV